MRWMETWLMFSILTTWIFYSPWLPCQLRCLWPGPCWASLLPLAVIMPTWSWEEEASLPLLWHHSHRAPQTRLNQLNFNRSWFRRHQRQPRFSEMKMTCMTVSHSYWFPPKRNEDPRAKKSNLMVRYIKFTQHQIQKTNSSLMRRRQKCFKSLKEEWLIRSTLLTMIWVH